MHAADCGIGKVALFEDLGLTLCGMLHRYYDGFRADEQIHCTAHTGHTLAGDEPVGKRHLFINLETAENGCIDVAAADEGEARCAVDIACAGRCACGVAACIDDMDGITGLIGHGCGAENAVLALENDMYAFGKIIGDEGGNADTEVDDIAVLELLGYSLCDKGFDLILIHQ